MIPICEKSKVTSIKKCEIFKLAPILHIFRNFFLTESHTYFCTLCKSNDFILSCFESRHIFQKN